MKKALCMLILLTYSAISIAAASSKKKDSSQKPSKRIVIKQEFDEKKIKEAVDSLQQKQRRENLGGSDWLADYIEENFTPPK